MKCKCCKDEPAKGCQGLCPDCQRLKELFQAMTPEQVENVKRKSFQMVDDMLDQKFGPEPGTVIN